MKKLFILDYDNTLAKPKSPPTRNITKLLSTLLEQNKKIAILTAGRSIKGLKELLVNEISESNPYLLSNLYLCPKYGNIIFAWENDWFVIYESSNLTTIQKKNIKKAIKSIPWGNYLERSISKQKIYDKGSVISINCLGNDATDSQKEIWDKEGLVRKQIKQNLLASLENRFEIYITGRNTIDIIPKGRNKANNILKLLKLTSCSTKDSIYIGDEFSPDGNDYPITFLDIEIHKVKNPSDTAKFLKMYI